MEKDFYEWILRREGTFVESNVRDIFEALDDGDVNFAIACMTNLEREYEQECQDHESDRREEKQNLTVPKGE